MAFILGFKLGINKTEGGKKIPFYPAFYYSFHKKRGGNSNNEVSADKI
jgi:hypothetical protein